MSVPVMKPERRQAPRIRPEGIAYINFEPENGGIVLDVSEQGICFQSVAPLPATKDDVLHFWFSAEGNRIDAQGHIAWLDDKRKTGGVQFQTLTPKARLQIQDWIRQSREPFPRAKRTTAPALGPASASTPNSMRISTPQPEEKKLEPPTQVAPRVAVQRAPAPLATAKATSKGKIASISSAASLLQQRLPALRVSVRWTEYSRGLFTGLLVSTIALAGFLLHANRKHVGEMLIHLGERFAATSQAPPASSAPERPALDATAERGSPLPHEPSRPARASARSVPPVSQPRTGAARVVPPKPERASEQLPQSAPQTVLPSPKSAMPPNEPVSVPARPLDVSGEAGKSLRPVQPALSGPVLPSLANPKVLELKPAEGPPENANDSAALNLSVPLGKYFQIGKFGDELQADKIIEKLNGSGYHAIVVPRNLLWMSSYEVLAGPYSDEKEAQTARRGLRSEGFKAQNLPRESREFWLPVVKKLYSDDIPEGFVVTWQSYAVEATVQYIRGVETITTAHGKWVKENERHDRDGVMYDNRDGSRMLLEIWFRGMDQSVVFAPESRAIKF
jgi:PilZ domain/SPOR domain